MSFNEFENELLNSRKEISDAIGKQIYGFRAPCFSIDRDRIDIVKSLGFQYDSSKINFGAHPLYKNINMVGYDNKRLDIYNLDDFFIFQATTTKILGKNFPISGGVIYEYCLGFYQKGL